MIDAIRARDEQVERRCTERMLGRATLTADEADQAHVDRGVLLAALDAKARVLDSEGLTWLADLEPEQFAEVVIPGPRLAALRASFWGAQAALDRLAAVTVAEVAASVKVEVKLAPPGTDMDLACHHIATAVLALVRARVAGP